MAATATPTDSAAAQNRLGMSNWQVTPTIAETTCPPTTAQGGDKAAWGTANDNTAVDPIDANITGAPRLPKYQLDTAYTVSTPINAPAEDTSFSVWVVVFLGIPSRA